MDEVFGLFPVPVLRARAVLGRGLIAGLVAHFERQALAPNRASGHLAHTQLLDPGDSPLLVQVAAALTPKVVDMGALMFGERLGWSIKEMWVNVLDHGGQQAMHNHANSFVSGVVYLTPTHASAQTVFLKAPGGSDFAFRHEHAQVTPTPFNAERWVSPAPEPGDVILFPSYLMHAVPHNDGGRRVTLAFNAIPSGLESWGYRVGFSA